VELVRVGRACVALRCPSGGGGQAGDVADRSPTPSRLGPGLRRGVGGMAAVSDPVGRRVLEQARFGRAYAALCSPAEAGVQLGAVADRSLTPSRLGPGLRRGVGGMAAVSEPVGRCGLALARFGRAYAAFCSPAEAGVQLGAVADRSPTPSQLGPGLRRGVREMAAASYPVGRRGLALARFGRPYGALRFPPEGGAQLGDVVDRSLTPSRLGPSLRRGVRVGAAVSDPVGRRGLALARFGRAYAAFCSPAEAGGQSGDVADRSPTPSQPVPGRCRETREDGA
jgi:hypothetical protein